MKHELKIVELKLSLKKNGGKNDFDIKAKNIDLRSQLSKGTSELESIKLKHVELGWIDANKVSTWETIC